MNARYSLPLAGLIVAAVLPQAAGRAPEVRVGSQPLNVIAAGTTLWTENYGDGTVSAIDAVTRRVRTIRVGGTPGGIAYGSGSVWVSDLSGGMLIRLDPGGEILAHIELGQGRGAGVTVYRGVVYVADYGGGGVWRVDAASNRVLGRTKVAGHAESVAGGFGRVWVTNSNGTLSTLDPATGAVRGRPIRIGSDADDVAMGRRAVWAVALYGQRLVRIEPASRKVVSRTPTRGQASGVLATRHGIWVSNYDLDTVSRFDLAGKRIVRTYRVGSAPRSLAAAAGAIWVANQHSGSVSRLAP
jgi:YVTN family beta-propeller protein